MLRLCVCFRVPRAYIAISEISKIAGFVLCVNSDRAEYNWLRCHQAPKTYKQQSILGSAAVALQLVNSVRAENNGFDVVRANWKAVRC